MYTDHVTLSRNTIDVSGGGAIGPMWGAGDIVELNRVTRTVTPLWGSIPLD